MSRDVENHFVACNADLRISKRAVSGGKAGDPGGMFKLLIEPQVCTAYKLRSMARLCTFPSKAAASKDEPARAPLQFALLLDGPAEEPALRKRRRDGRRLRAIALALRDLKDATQAVKERLNLLSARCFEQKRVV
eukprot:5030620-Pleurochrysis_carterae.AAC.3